MYYRENKINSIESLNVLDRFVKLERIELYVSDNSFEEIGSLVSIGSLLNLNHIQVEIR